MILLWLALACGHASSPDAAPSSTPVAAVSSDPAASPAVSPDAAASPAVSPAVSPAPALPVSAHDLYGACRERVEGHEAPGECVTDADCATAGCSQEVCVPRAAAGSVITTCERTPCLTVLDHCGCQAGVCSWTLKEPAIPLRMRPTVAPATPSATP